MADNKNPEQHQPASTAQPAETGNASNPSPQANNENACGEQLLPKEAEKYLREAGNIEDEPDAQDQEAMDETISRQSENSGG